MNDTALQQIRGCEISARSCAVINNTTTPTVILIGINYVKESSSVR